MKRKFIGKFVKGKVLQMRKYVHHKWKKIYYSDSGSGFPVVLVHGYLETGEVWSDFAGRLSACYRVIVADLPGHGKSDIFGEVHTMDGMAEALNELISSLGLNRVFIIGHSMGGYVTLAFLQLYPEKLKGYCLFHSHPFADSAEILEKRRREIETVAAGKKFLIYPESIRRMYADSNLESFREELEKSERIASGIRDEGITAALRGMMARPSRLEIMEAGSVPCLWVLGAMDNYIPCDSMISRISLPQNAELAVLQNSGHLGFIEERELSVLLIEEFIKKINR